MYNFQISFFIKSIIYFLLLSSCNQSKIARVTTKSNEPIGHQLTTAKSKDGKYISWREHIIDDTFISGISGSDGLSIGDLDQDGIDDIVSVHESDTEYDGISKGHIRIAFGTTHPDEWTLTTLGEGAEAGGAEDVAIADINGDGYLDVIGACELAHLIYFQNPGKNIRSQKWERVIPEAANHKGSYIRVFTADFNNDGKIEIVAANKGDQMSDGSKDAVVNNIKPISYFEVKDDPLDPKSWIEHELIRVRIPINSQPIDIDKDGDEDIIAGSRGEGRIILLENVSEKRINFIRHDIHIKSLYTDSTKIWTCGFNMDFKDLDRDGRLDIILTDAEESGLILGSKLIWLKQPANWSKPWIANTIGNTQPDQIVGLIASDIDDDGHIDVMIGGYSRGARDKDGTSSIHYPLGRLSWFQNPIDLTQPWIRHDISRRERGMFDKFIIKDMDNDGDKDFISTRGNSNPYDGVFWLEQVRTLSPVKVFTPARKNESPEMELVERVIK